MDILKSLKLILHFRLKGAKRTKLESWEMAHERFISHLTQSLKGHAHRSRYTPNGIGSPKMDRRIAQSKMDRTAHALFLAKLRLALIP
mgnify:CR=1 FL=1